MNDSLIYFLQVKVVIPQSRNTSDGFAFLGKQTVNITFYEGILITDARHNLNLVLSIMLCMHFMYIV